MHILRKFCLYLLAMLSAIPAAWSQIDPAQVMPVDPNVRIGKLPNGLTYYIRKNMLPEKRVELRLLVNAGSVLEDDDQLGLAHFMEHMNFNGTKRFPKNELVSYLQSIGVKFGADLNAYTGFDETVYILPVPTDTPGLVEKGLEILEDWAHQALLDSAEIEKERGVVIEEWRVGRGAAERMMKQTLPVQYRDSRYAGRLPIGTIESLQTFSHAALKRFYTDWYRPDLQAVIAVGDIDVAEMEQKIREIFGDIPAPANPRKREAYPVPDHEEPLSVIARDKETAFPGIEILFKKAPQPDVTIADYTRYINRLLFTGMLNSRFREIALKPNPPFIAASSTYGKTYARTKDAFQLYANTSDTGMNKALSSLLAETRRVLVHGFSESEFDRQKKQLLSFYERIFHERTKEESFKYVNEYMNHFLVGEPIPSIEWEYDFVKQYLQTVKLADVNRLASAWITPQNLVVTMNAPDKPEVQTPSGEEVKSMVSSLASAAVEPFGEKLLASSLMDGNILKPGSTRSVEIDEDLGTSTLFLSNGVTVILKPTNYKNDEILMRAFSKGGHSLARDEDYYSASQAAQVVQQSGVSDFSAADLGNMMKGRNTNVSPNISLYSEGMNGYTIPKETETFLQLVHLYFTSPRKDKDAFASYITKQKQLYTNLASNPQIYYSGELQKILTRNHPRAGGLLKPADFDQVNLDRAIQIYKERFSNAADFTFIFTGAINEDSIKPLLEKYLGSLPGRPVKENFRDLGIRPPTGMTEKQIVKGTEPQGQVNIVFTRPAAYNTNDLYALRSLGELVTMKLVEQLREEKAAVYGVNAAGNLNKYPYPHASFHISFPCAPENADTLSMAAIAELKKIIRDGVKPADLAKIREQQKRKLEVDMRQNLFWVNNLYDAFYNGTNPRLILQKEKQVETLTSKMLQDVARKYIDPLKFIRTVLVPEKPVLPAEKPVKAF